MSPNKPVYTRKFVQSAAQYLLLTCALLAAASPGNAFWPFASTYDSPAGIVIEHGNSTTLIQGQTSFGVLAPVGASAALASVPFAVRYGSYAASLQFPGQALHLWSLATQVNRGYSMAMLALSAYSLGSMFLSLGHTGYLKARNLVNRHYCLQRQGVMQVYIEPYWLASHFNLEARFEAGKSPSLVVRPLKKMTLPSGIHGDAPEAWHQLSSVMAELGFIELDLNVVMNDGQSVLRMSALDQQGIWQQKELTGFNEAPWDLELLNDTCSSHGDKNHYSIFQPELIRAVAAAWRNNPANLPFLARVETISNEDASVHRIPDAGYQLVHSEYSSYMNPSPGFLLLASDNLPDEHLLSRASRDDASLWAYQLSSQSIWQKWTTDLALSAVHSCTSYATSQLASHMLTPAPPASTPQCVQAQDNVFGTPVGSHDILVSNEQSMEVCQKGTQTFNRALSRMGCVLLEALDPLHQQIMNTLLTYSASHMLSRTQAARVTTAANKKTGSSTSATDHFGPDQPVTGTGAEAMRKQRLEQIYRWLGPRLKNLSVLDRIHVFRFSSFRDMSGLAYAYLQWMQSPTDTSILRSIAVDNGGIDPVLSAFANVQDAKEYAELSSTLTELATGLKAEVSETNQYLNEKIHIESSFKEPAPIEIVKKLTSLSEILNIPAIKDLRLINSEETIVIKMEKFASVIMANFEPRRNWFYNTYRRQPSGRTPHLSDVMRWSTVLLSDTELADQAHGFVYSLFFNSKTIKLNESRILSQMETTLSRMLNDQALVDETSRNFYAWVALMFFDKNLLATSSSAAASLTGYGAASATGYGTSYGVSAYAPQEKSKVNVFLEIAKTPHLLEEHVRLNPPYLASNALRAVYADLTQSVTNSNLSALASYLVQKGFAIQLTVDGIMSISGIPNYQKAARLLGIVSSSIQFAPKKLVDFIEILRQLDLTEVAENLIDKWKEQSGTSLRPLTAARQSDSGKSTPEYRAFLTVSSNLSLSIQNSLIEVATGLYSRGLISPESFDKATYEMHAKKDRAYQLISAIRSMVELSTANYHTFIEVLNDSGNTHRDVLMQLQEAYAAF